MIPVSGLDVIISVIFSCFMFGRGLAVGSFAKLILVVTKALVVLIWVCGGVLAFFYFSVVVIGQKGVCD